MAVDEYEELELLRDRVDQLEATLANLHQDAGDGARNVVAKVITQGSFPTQAQAVYAMKIQSISAARVEGAIPTFTDQQSVIYAANIGTGPTAVPQTTLELVSQDQQNWFFADSTT